MEKHILYFDFDLLDTVPDRFGVSTVLHLSKLAIPTAQRRVKLAADAGVIERVGTSADRTRLYSFAPGVSRRQMAELFMMSPRSQMLHLLRQLPQAFTTRHVRKVLTYKGEVDAFMHRVRSVPGITHAGEAWGNPYSSQRGKHFMDETERCVRCGGFGHTSDNCHRMPQVATRIEERTV